MSTYLLENGVIFDGHSPDIVADRYILIKDDRIAALTTERPEEAVDNVVDLKGKFVMPGLIDAHFHAYAASLDISHMDNLPMTYLAQHGRILLQNSLMRGFTTVRDAGGADYGLWLAVEQGLFPSPRLFYSGRALSQTGGHGDSRGPHIEPCGCSALGSLTEVVDGVDDIRKVVRDHLRRGAHQIKIMVSGGIASPTDPIWMLQYSEEEIRIVVEEASRKRSYVMAHAYTAESIERAVKAGVRSIEHGNLIDGNAARLVAEKQAFVVPTLATYEAIGKYGTENNAPQEMVDKLDIVKDKGLEAIQICRDAGVKLGFGTDLLGDLHSFQRDEFRLRREVEAAFDILHSATAVNAELLQMPDEIGVIKDGAFADMLVINGNPLEDLSLLYEGSNAIDMIIKAGKIY